MNTHALVWDAVSNDLRVISVEEMLSTNRRAYTDGRVKFGVPIAWGSEADMAAAMVNCQQTLFARRKAATQ